jgi:prepilin-type N-terminal cleavage/methylation domain-containing protein
MFRTLRNTQHSQTSRTGFSLIELLVVIAVIALLVAILMPAVQMARESARKSMCTNNLRQFGIALHAYHDTSKVFPSGQVHGSTTGLSSWGWGAMLLPHIEQSTIYNKLDFKRIVGNPATDAVAVKSMENIQIPFPQLRCPSDPDLAATDKMNTAADAYHAVTPGMSTMSYYPNAGAFNTYDHGENKLWQNGVMFINSSVRIDDISDGTTYTVLLGEVARKQTTYAGRYYGAVNAAGEICCNEQVMRDGQYRLNYGGDLTTDVGSRKYGYSSSHRGGAYFLFGDNHVKFLSDNIEHIPSVNAGEAANGSGCRWDDAECSDNPAAPGFYKQPLKLKTKFGLYQQYFSRNDKIPMSDF